LEEKLVMPIKRYKPEQIVTMLRQIEVSIANGKPTPQAVGMEASGQARWLERLLAELNFELWIGDAAEIQSKRVRAMSGEPAVSGAA